MTTPGILLAVMTLLGAMLVGTASNQVTDDPYLEMATASMVLLEGVALIVIVTLVAFGWL